MASEAAALLDELMGRNRNAHPNESVGEIKWDNKEVCKHFLCGYCPSELFVNTKADLGPCTLLHDEPLKKEYQQSARFEKMGYEEVWIEALEGIVGEVDKKIKRGHQRLAMTQNDSSPPRTNHGPRQEQITQLTAKINDLVDQAEKLGNEGKVEEAQGVMKLCEQLKKERQQLENISNDRQDNMPQSKQMEVCPICGAFLIVGDAESRQREHLMGKQHMGYAQMRATVEDYRQKKLDKIAVHKAEMEKKREEERKRRDDREKERRRSRSRDRGRRGGGGGSRERRRSRSRDRRRSKSRDRRRASRSRDGGRRDRSRDRRRSRDRGDRRESKGSRACSRERKDRSRDRDRERRRTRSRERSRERRDRAARRRSKSKERRRSRSTDRRRSGSKDRTDNSKDAAETTNGAADGNSEMEATSQGSNSVDSDAGGGGNPTNHVENGVESADDSTMA